MSDKIGITTSYVVPLGYPYSHGHYSRRSKTMTTDTQETINSDRKDRLALIVILLLCAIATVALFALIQFSPNSGGILPPVTPGNIIITNPDDKSEEPDGDKVEEDNQTQVEGDTQSGETTGSDQPDNQSGNGGGASSDPHAGQTWHPAWDETVLVRAAWTEYVTHPAVYNTVHHSEAAHWGARCNQCGADISGYASQHLLDNAPSCYSYTTNYKFIDQAAWDESVLVSSAWTEEIYHPAEYRNIHHEGYWE